MSKEGLVPSGRILADTESGAGYIRNYESRYGGEVQAKAPKVSFVHASKHIHAQLHSLLSSSQIRHNSTFATSVRRVLSVVPYGLQAFSEGSRALWRHFYHDYER